MSSVLERDRSGRSFLVITCDGCPRSAATDVFNEDAFCALIGWERSGGSAWCTRCQQRRGDAATVARLYVERA